MAFQNRILLLRKSLAPLGNEALQSFVNQILFYQPVR